ncbi:DNA-binding LytR/AlgR family response regulator [Flavobacterium sp. W4I14]|nr:DNA-binding LytR/AlgR family response regulator [Flavobacterium sp. W4I14]
MKVFSCIIIDDDPQAVELLVECIQLSPHLTLIKFYTDPIIAQREIAQFEKPIDILFTDVEMPGLSGLELAETINQKVNCLVLVSSHLQYALEGYNVNAQQFLSKPFDYKKFEKIMGNLMNRLKVEDDFIMIRLGGKNNALKLYLKEIIAIESASNYLKVHTLEKTYIPYGTLNAMEEELKFFADFKRISRSFMINTRFIKNINRYKILMEKDLYATVGNSYQKGFDAYFDELTKKKKNNS